jgi:hypothetical protein
MALSRVIRGHDTLKLREFVNDVMPTASWISNGFGRRFVMYEQAPGFDEIFSLYGMKPIKIEPVFQCLIGNHYRDGAFVHEHQDSNSENLFHVRVNVMLKKPIRGGNPVLNGIELHVDEGDIWLCLAGSEKHSSTPIYGSDRLIFSYGGLVEVLP